jgi:FKBP-type peptidyl-prolyl cis-trans isomerase 2
MVGEEVEVPLSYDETILPYSNDNIFILPRSPFNRNFFPHLGRFYPKKFLQNVSGAVKEKISPFSCIKVDYKTIQFYFNHPLSQKTLKVAAKVEKIIKNTREERGGRYHEWGKIITSNGIDFQTRYKKEQPSYFFSSFWQNGLE